jgi:hypothetical protein
MEAETRLGTVGAELEALGGELEEMRAALEGLREEADYAARRSSTWRALFARALALAAREHAGARQWQAAAEENGRKYERAAGRAQSFWQRLQTVRENSLRQRRTLRGLLRSERRHAAGVRQVCRAALEQLEDVHGGWTVHGVGVRQELRRVLGLPLAPICPVCGVDWWKPVLQADGKPCSVCCGVLGEEAGTAPRAGTAHSTTARPRRLRRASGRPLSLGCPVCGAEGCVREHEGASP